jgi:hypothetical protein
VTEHVFRRLALALTGVVEGSHMAHPDFRVAGRIFATLKQDRRTGMAVLTPEQQREFIAEHPDVFEPESGAWGRQGCTRIHLGDADEDVVGHALTLAWQQAQAKGPAGKAKGGKRKASR